MKKDSQFLVDMLQSAELVQKYTTGCSKDEFINNELLQDAVMRRLLVIAEAARRVSGYTRQNLFNISWKEINKMRNLLVHEYDDIDLDIVWAVVQQEIPILIRELKLEIPFEE